MPGYMSLSLRACSRALRSSGLKIAGRAARLIVPSSFIASLPTLRVSGTCLASTIMLKLMSYNGFSFISKCVSARLVPPAYLHAARGIHSEPAKLCRTKNFCKCSKKNSIRADFAQKCPDCAVWHVPLSVCRQACCGVLTEMSGGRVRGRQQVFGKGWPQNNGLWLFVILSKAGMADAAL